MLFFRHSSKTFMQLFPSQPQAQPKPKTKHKTKEPVIYTLALRPDPSNPDQPLFYVGKTTRDNVHFRYMQHYHGIDGSEWTRLHKPFPLPAGICGQRKGDGFDEDSHVLRLMHKHGIQHVRGGRFSQVVLSIEQIKEIEQLIRSATDKCFHCGSKDHFISQCPKNSPDNVIDLTND